MLEGFRIPSAEPPVIHMLALTCFDPLLGSALMAQACRLGSESALRTPNAGASLGAYPGAGRTRNDTLAWHVPRQVMEEKLMMLCP